MISKAPLGLLYSFSNLIFVVGFYFLRYRRKVVQENLRNSFPTMNDAELGKVETEFYRNLSDYAVETLKLLTIPKIELGERMKFINPEVVHEFTNKGESVLLLASHQFNWEWLLASGSFSLSIPIDFVYQPQNDQFFDDFSLLGRTRFGAYPIKRETVGRVALKRKHIVRGTAIVADQFPGHFNFKRYWTTFLGQRTAFFQGISQLAVLTQSPVFYAAIKKIRRGFYEVELISLATPPFDAMNSDRVIERYVEQTEKTIRLHPEGWLWSHKRWKELD
jgi:Kdo2-lipid IVA lauroyltransferase/acyltransferase